jgi:hypothetical protein
VEHPFGLLIEDGWWVAAFCGPPGRSNRLVARGVLTEAEPGLVTTADPNKNIGGSST